ncbi:hypothetical protein ACFL4D_03305, partial [Candidatus Margulisiibacteriota bacterium]
PLYETARRLSSMIEQAQVHDPGISENTVIELQIAVSFLEKVAGITVTAGDATEDIEVIMQKAMIAEEQLGIPGEEKKSVIADRAARIVKILKPKPGSAFRTIRLMNVKYTEDHEKYRPETLIAAMNLVAEDPIFDAIAQESAQRLKDKATRRLSERIIDVSNESGGLIVEDMLYSLPADVLRETVAVLPREIRESKGVKKILEEKGIEVAAVDYTKEGKAWQTTILAPAKVHRMMPKAEAVETLRNWTEGASPVIEVTEENRIRINYEDRKVDISMSGAKNSILVQNFSADGEAEMPFSVFTPKKLGELRQFLVDTMSIASVDGKSVQRLREIIDEIPTMAKANQKELAELIPKMQEEVQEYQEVKAKEKASRANYELAQQQSEEVLAMQATMLEKSTNILEDMPLEAQVGMRKALSQAFKQIGETSPEELQRMSEEFQVNPEAAIQQMQAFTSSSGGKGMSLRETKQSRLSSNSGSSRKEKSGTVRKAEKTVTAAEMAERFGTEFKDLSPLEKAALRAYAATNNVVVEKETWS